LVLSGVLVSAALSCQKPSVRYEIPVSVPCPEPPVLIWPVLPAELINQESTDADVVRAHLASKVILEGRLAEALTILNGYRVKTLPTTVPDLRSKK